MNSTSVQADVRAQLARLGMTDFDAWWQLPRTWFEEPNREGGGWSGVSRHEFPMPDGGTLAVFVKRQENYFMKRRLGRWLKITSLMRETRNLRRVAALGIGVAPELYFGTRRVGRDIQSVLVLQALDDYVALDTLVADWAVGLGSFAQQRRVARELGRVVARLHAARLCYNALYPKHIYVHRAWLAGTDTADSSIRFIDLERVKRSWSQAACLREDLEKLNRHCGHLPAGLRLAFYLAYRGITRLADEDKRILRELSARSRRKGR